MELGLRGRKALITGASRGIGRACAEVLAEEGCDVVLVSRTAADLDAAKSKITAQHNVAVRCFPLAEMDEARWRSAWDLKVFGYINMTRRFYALMAERKQGVIINIIGAAGENVQSNYITGSTGNASLMAFPRAMGGTRRATGCAWSASTPAWSRPTVW